MLLKHRLTSNKSHSSLSDLQCLTLNRPAHNIPVVKLTSLLSEAESAGIIAKGQKPEVELGQKPYHYPQKRRRQNCNRDEVQRRGWKHSSPVPLIGMAKSSLPTAERVLIVLSSALHGLHRLHIIILIPNPHTPPSLRANL